MISSDRLRALAFGVVLAANGARGQSIRPSQLGTVSQSIATTRIDIEYRRPVARGRELFGVLVPFGRVWAPSADTAPVFSVSTPITVNDQPLGAGTYSIWAIPDRESWTIIFSTEHPTFHMRYPSGHDALRVTTTPTEGEHMETLAFYFPMVDADSARLVLHWGKTIVPLTIKSQHDGP